MDKEFVPNYTPSPTIFSNTDFDLENYFQIANVNLYFTI